MNRIKTKASSTALMLLLLAVCGVAAAAPFTQCPGDSYIEVYDGTGALDPVATLPGSDMVQDKYRYDAGTGTFILKALGTNVPAEYDQSIKCMHLGAGDGFVRMADNDHHLQYIFSFTDLTGTDTSKTMDNGALAANYPAPTIELEEGQKFYLSLSNVGMAMRPDLSDPHTVHFHGFPNASDTFDGVPDATISINMGSTLTYFYNIVEPGTYMYHCHVEATEHMQMGMLGNLYVHAAQDKTPVGTPLCGTGPLHVAGKRYAYNDCDGTTAYDVEKAIQLGSFDSVFHDEHLLVQPLPFANMKDNYAMFNGRGYPDSTFVGNLPAPIDPDTGVAANASEANPVGTESQKVDALVQATQGQTILLRLSNLNVTKVYTIRALGMDMRVIGRGARQMRSPTGTDVDYLTNHVNIGPGEGVDVLLDTTNVAPGTYFLYSTNLNYLTNNQEEFGGMMTEIRIAAGL